MQQVCSCFVANCSPKKYSTSGSYCERHSHWEARKLNGYGRLEKKDAAAVQEISCRLATRSVWNRLIKFEFNVSNARLLGQIALQCLAYMKPTAVSKMQWHMQLEYVYK